MSGSRFGRVCRLLFFGWVRIRCKLLRVIPWWWWVDRMLTIVVDVSVRLWIPLGRRKGPDENVNEIVCDTVNVAYHLPGGFRQLGFCTN